MSSSTVNNISGQPLVTPTNPAQGTSAVSSDLFGSAVTPTPTPTPGGYGAPSMPMGSASPMAVNSVWDTSAAPAGGYMPPAPGQAGNAVIGNAAGMFAGNPYQNIATPAPAAPPAGGYGANTVIGAGYAASSAPGTFNNAVAATPGTQNISAPAVPSTAPRTIRNNQAVIGDSGNGQTSTNPYTATAVPLGGNSVASGLTTAQLNAVLQSNPTLAQQLAAAAASS